MIKGIDVSNNNDPIDMNLFAKEGNKFVVCKATQGTWFIDKYFQNYVRAARSAGMKVGAYHYAEYNNITNALIEANLFLTTAMQEKVDFLALDIESDKQIGDLTVATNAFMQVIHSAGVPILIYSYPEFIKAHFDTSIQQYDLWISNMNVSYPDIYCWNEYKMWQYTIENDIDRNYMTEEFYNKL
jgi:GH25 family lysozyme M1 (1,4-beta-N-acetylmuramidase)